MFIYSLTGRYYPPAPTLRSSILYTNTELDILAPALPRVSRVFFVYRVWFQTPGDHQSPFITVVWQVGVAPLPPLSPLIDIPEPDFSFIQRPGAISGILCWHIVWQAGITLLPPLSPLKCSSIQTELDILVPDLPRVSRVCVPCVWSQTPEDHQSSFITVVDRSVLPPLSRLNSLYSICRAGHSGARPSPSLFLCTMNTKIWK